MNKKQSLEFFRNDHWSVRLAVFLGEKVFKVAVVGIILGRLDPSLAAALLNMVLK
jgi:hypothetical protein